MLVGDRLVRVWDRRVETRQSLVRGGDQRRLILTSDIVFRDKCREQLYGESCQRLLLIVALKSESFVFSCRVIATQADGCKYATSVNVSL